MRRLGEVLYKRQSQLPAIITSNVRVFAMVNYRPEDVVEDWLFLLEYLKSRSWSEQKVEDFLVEAKKRASWPNARFQTHVSSTVDCRWAMCQQATQGADIVCDSARTRIPCLASFLGPTELLHSQEDV